MSATPEQAKQIVLVGVLSAGALAAIGQARKGNVPSAKIAVGVTVSGAILLGAAEFVPALAASFGALILVTAMFVTGADAWEGITIATGGKPKATTAPKPKK